MSKYCTSFLFPYWRWQDYHSGLREKSISSYSSVVRFFLFFVKITKRWLSAVLNVKKSIFIFLFFVHGWHQRSIRWYRIGTEQEQSLFRCQFDSFTDHVVKLSNGQVWKKGKKKRKMNGWFKSKFGSEQYKERERGDDVTLTCRNQIFLFVNIRNIRSIRLFANDGDPIHILCSYAFRLWFSFFYRCSIITVFELLLSLLSLKKKKTRNGWLFIYAWVNFAFPGFSSLRAIVQWSLYLPNGCSSLNGLLMVLCKVVRFLNILLIIERNKEEVLFGTYSIKNTNNT